MLIHTHGLTHWINNFFGYGSWEAKLWFVAHEETGGDLPEDVADKLNYFHRVHPEKESTLCEIRDLYKNVMFRQSGPKSEVYSTLYDYRFGDKATQHGFWKNLISFAHGYSGKKLPNLLRYQQERFASSSLRSEAWIQLYPLPSPHNHAWYYSWLDLEGFDFLKSRTLYEDQLFQTRITAILHQVRAHKPEAVVMYGMNNIVRLKKSIQATFPTADFKAIKGTARQIPQHHRAEIDGTTIIITTQIPGLRHNRIETGFDWEEFGRLVSS